MIYFIQPVLAKYRVSFFDELSLSQKIKVIYSSKDFLGVNSVENLEVNYDTEVIGNFFSIFNKLYWQKGIKFFSYTKNDIVVISGNPRVINQMLLMLICKIRGVPVIWWGQGYTAGSRGFFTRLRLAMMKIADGVAVYTEKEAKSLKHINHIVGLNNGLNIDNIRKFSNNEGAKNSKNNLLNLLFIGRLTKKSRVMLLLQALCNVDRPFHLHLIGDGDYNEEIKIFLRNNGIEDKVTLYGAIYEEREIANVANICDFFVYPGSVGLSLIHAYAYGLPAIIHNNERDHMPEFSAFKENYNGFSFLQEDAGSLAKLINHIDESCLAQMKKNAFQTVTESYNTKDMANRFLSLIEKLKK